MECNEYDSGSDCYEEIGVNGSDRPNVLRPSVLDLPGSGIHRTLWSQVPQVMSSGILDELSVAQQKLQEAKFELVTSEASYFKSLTVLEKHFASSPSMKDENVLPKMDYKILFSNVAPVRKCSEMVLAALDKCWQDSIMLDGICRTIYQLSQQNFNVYIKYCTNQVLIESTLKRLRQNSPNFAEALSTLEKSKKCQSLSLYSFLLLPMQRITRMPLLLDAIRNKLEPDTSEYDSCTLALAQLHKIAHECDEAARKAERFEEMAVLSRALNYPVGLRPLPLLSASRWLERSGQVTHINMEAKLTFSRKLTSRNIKLTLFLFTDYLIIAKKKEDNYSVVDYCPRNLVQVSKMDDAISSRFLIVLTMLENHEGKTQEMMLCCGSDSSRERWLQTFASPYSSNSEETLYADWDCPQVAATHAYSPAQPDELALQHGDVVNVLRKLSDGWYYGERIRDGERGWFPGNYTTEIASMHVRAKNLKLRYRLLALSGDYLQQLKNKNNS
ncbi:hypothetical protein AAG570_009660 [Ranatra chinensis]|uniref:Ephexin-1 n=1 Tax=Ranatra chinensis TaxID=642074 RepID=A0ABD0YPZ3_9HEMI